jgi:bifunctional DNase/RNase
MVLMRLHEMHACDTHDAAVIVLEDVDRSRRLTFSADPGEARRLADAVSRGPRACHPIYDFVRALLRALGTAPARVVLEDVDGRGIGALVVIRQGETDLAITCYPTDAVAIALREGLSIYATPAALDHAAPMARGDEVARWLHELRPGDFEA